MHSVSKLTKPLDELLKPTEIEGKPKFMNVSSVSIMGKAGILKGGKEIL